MTSRTGFLTIVATGLMVVFQPILADHVDGSDFLLWQRNFSFAPLETAEILIEQAYASPRHSITLTFAVNNEFGLILGLIETTVPANDPPNNHRNHGFGFVTMEIGASRDGVLLINGERFDDLTANPTTGRYAVGISLFSSRSPASGGGNARFGNATLSIIAPDGATRTSGEILTDPNSGKKVSG